MFHCAVETYFQFSISAFIPEKRINFKTCHIQNRIILFRCVHQHIVRWIQVSLKLWTTIKKKNSYLFSPPHPPHKCEFIDCQARSPKYIQLYRRRRRNQSRNLFMWSFSIVSAHMVTLCVNTNQVPHTKAYTYICVCIVKKIHTHTLKK